MIIKLIEQTTTPTTKHFDAVTIISNPWHDGGWGL